MFRVPLEVRDACVGRSGAFGGRYRLDKEVKWDFRGMHGM